MVSKGVKELIFQYFLTDVLETEPLNEDLRQNIIATFTYAYNHHIERMDLSSQVDDSAISRLRQRIIKRNRDNYSPFPVRLGSLKPILQQDAMSCNKSLHGYIIRILKNVEDKNREYFDSNCIPRLCKFYKKKRHKYCINNQLEIFT